MMLAGVIAAVAFVALAGALCVAAVLAVLGTAHVYLSGPEAIERDGLARGRQAPRWSLADSAGVVHRSPPARPLQLVIFADHSLKSFPSVVDGLRSLLPPAGGAGGIGGSPPLDGTARRDPGLEIVVLLRQRNDLAEPLLRMIGLDGVPVLTGTPSLYAAYNVRVGPFAIFVDADGQVRASSLVNHDWQLAKLHQVAGLPIAAGETARPRRLRRPHRQPRPAV
ncbi:MAG TPA: hypothetical protein VHU92_28785 [Streptosporangiaceae bacterium]|jgi:hypothetical protein|nr:hypothetical protein [Streptosporangiaceae bacterium]